MSWKNKKIYRQAGKCDKQQQFKDIIESDMVSTPEGFIEKVLYLPGNQHQSRNKVLKNHCVCLLTF